MTDATLEKIKQFSSDQYSNEHRLNARIQIYRYGENKVNLREWTFKHLDFSNVKDVLELGAGNGLFWKTNIGNIPKDIRIVLTDVSQGMLDAAGDSLKPFRRCFEYALIDADKEMPYPENSFQMIIANHMLYHVKELTQTLTDINRVLTPDGAAYATTLSRQNTRELIKLALGFDRRLWFDNLTIRSFNMENGRSMISNHFDNVEEFVYQNNIIVNNPEPLILYLASGYSDALLDILVEKLDDFRLYLRGYLRKNGPLRITNNTVLYKFRKK